MRHLYKLLALAVFSTAQMTSAQATVLNFDFDSASYAGLSLVGNSKIIQPGVDLTGLGAPKMTNPVVGNPTFLAAGVFGTGSATLSLAPSLYRRVNFLWGTVDTTNSVAFSLSNGTTQTVFGSDLGVATNGTLSHDFLWGTGAADVYVNSITFANVGGSGSAFELDNLNVSPVPEPEQYGLLLVGLGLIGLRKKFMA